MLNIRPLSRADDALYTKFTNEKREETTKCNSSKTNCWSHFASSVHPGHQTQPNLFENNNKMIISIISKSNWIFIAWLTGMDTCIWCIFGDLSSLDFTLFLRNCRILCDRMLFYERKKKITFTVKFTVDLSYPKMYLFTDFTSLKGFTEVSIFEQISDEILRKSTNSTLIIINKNNQSHSCAPMEY